MKFYTDLTHYRDKSDWVNVPHVIRPYFVAKEKGLDIKLAEIFTDNIEDADFAFLPMNLEYYYVKGLQDQMNSFIDKAKIAGKPVFAANDGDAGVKYDLNGVIVLCQNGYQSTRKNNEYGHPFIVDDPLPIYFNCKEIFIRDKREKPVIGFDGLAGESIFKIIINVLRGLLHNIKFCLGRTIFAKNKLIPGTVYRDRALKAIENDYRVVSNFNRRTQFRAGAKTPEEQKKKTREFYENMRDSDYILCCRGVGNFSKRLYETLAMGRIPVFINTDCILPFDTIIDWRKYCVWVEQDEITYIGDKIMEFHNKLSNEEFQSLQIACRKMWKEYLTEYGELTSLALLIK